MCRARLIGHRIGVFRELKAEVELRARRAWMGGLEAELFEAPVVAV